jgi:molybdate transport system substrate-binding protein
VKTLRRFRCAVVLASTFLVSFTASAAEMRVMTSGAFTAAYLALIPRCGESLGDSVVTVTTTMGVGSTSIPSRLEHGEAVDVVILARESLDDLTMHGWVVPGSEVNLARSAIAMAVKAGAPKPDIGSVAAFRRALLSAKSIAYSASVSGDYLSKELFQQLGVADQVLPKSRRVEGGRVGEAVARGDAEIGFQQISELLPITGIDYVGPLPTELQRVTVFSGGVATNSTQRQRAQAFVGCLASREAASTIAASGLEPRHVVPELRPEFRELTHVGPPLAK